MSWHDATKIDESAEDRALRDELQKMLGLDAIQHPTVAPSPDSIALAQLLHREAMRRRRTASVAKPIGRRPFLLIAAATLPVLFAVSALGTWGVKQKRRADALAAKTEELESRQLRIDSAIEGARTRENQPLLQASESAPAGSPDTKPDKAPNGKSNTGELVKPEEQPKRLTSRPDQYRVNEPR
jgi:hypothetical protein